MEGQKAGMIEKCEKKDNDGKETTPKWKETVE